jgi:GNAT superfamily N-acetyltransferase
VENACFPTAEAATEAAFRSRIATFPERFLVAEEDGHIVGLINGCCTTAPVLEDVLYEENCPHSLSNPWQTVFGLAVRPEYQHRGIAKALMSQLIDLCRNGAQVGIILTCKQEKIGFYESMGFRCRGVSDSSHGGAQWYDMVLTL